jgi:hypothetical protein
MARSGQAEAERNGGDKSSDVEQKGKMKLETTRKMQQESEEEIHGQVSLFDGHLFKVFYVEAKLMRQT